MRANGTLSRSDLEKLGNAYLKGQDMSGTRKIQEMARAQAAVIHQDFEKLTKKIDVIFTERDPYKSFEELAHDVKHNKRMYVYTLFSETPLWDEQTNWMARAVHDMDHVNAGVDFSVEGELAAYQYASGKRPGFEPLYLSEIALQAASSMLLGAFESGPQRLVIPEYDVAKTARKFQRNGSKRNAYAVLDASAALTVMTPEDLMKRYAAEGVPFDEALLVVTAAQLMS